MAGVSHVGEKINGNKVKTDYFELNKKLFHGRKARVFLMLFSLTPVWELKL
jgi:hypothetical protein